MYISPNKVIVAELDVSIRQSVFGSGAKNPTRGEVGSLKPGGKIEINKKKWVTKTMAMQHFGSIIRNHFPAVHWLGTWEEIIQQQQQQLQFLLLN